ncbi:hypothetical protein DVIR88_6g0004 [Drosophila virilis]|uniref:Uncharacterized protein n=1 Tax=Drosophila virilis TaxID=7244 RepID=D0Z781_DROVI|nr:hypothetical protein DVIR88_6g0004 [Drosophila virilis]
MDSEVVTKLSENDNTESVEDSKENVPPEATDTTKDQKGGDAIVNEDVASAEDDNESRHTEIKTTTIVTTKKDNGDEVPITETQTTTTVVVTKKDSEEETSQKETETTSSTVAIAKNGLASIKDNVYNVDNSQIKAEPKNSHPVKPELESDPITETAEFINKSGSQSSIPDTSTDAAEQNVSVSEKKEEEESEESDSTSDDEDVGEETEAKIKKNKDDRDESQPEVVAVEVKKAQDSAEKINNANKDINNEIENIISDIDINIKAQEKITQLKEQELQLIQKQKELANQIQQQQLLAQKLFAQNQLKEQELKAQQYQQNQLKEQELRGQQYQQNQLNEQELRAQQYQQQKQFQSHNEHKEEIAPKESSNLSRTVDLRKIFTPATDAPEILPKNRKLYASSAFYSPSLHPTVEDQVELARRISHSLSDISNQTSKGQSMYVNRKKRSVKWVHEGSGQDDIIETRSLSKENTEEILKPDLNKLEKMPLKLVMNPRGQMRDYNSLKESINVESGLLSPDHCAELITALQLQKGRGAELFAKRRRKAENWVVDETNAGIHSPSGIPDYQQYQARPATSPSILPAYSDAGKHRVQLNLHQDQLIEKYSKPGVQVVKSPWEAALQTGSASAAFLEDSRYQNQTPIASQASPVHFNQDVTDFPSSIPELPSRQPAPYYGLSNNLHNIRVQGQPNQPSNPQRELAYKPSVAQGWGGRNVELPRGLYVPKEISLSSYAPPPIQQQTSNFQSPTKPEFSKGYMTSHVGDAPSGFPISNPTSGLYSSVPPKQQLYAPASYQKVPPSSVQAAPQVNFNPSPLSFDKLSKFQESNQRNSGVSTQRYLNVNKQPAYKNVRNASPTPFTPGGIGNCAGFDNIQRSPFSSTPSNYAQNPYSPESHQLRAPAQCFNNSARGWTQAPNPQRNALSSKLPVATEGLPYSDF